MWKVLVVVLNLAVVLGAYAGEATAGAAWAHATPYARATSLSHNSSFHYGFDLSNEEPDSSGAVPAASASARRVLDEFAGSYVDQSIYGFGANEDPEPAPGVFDMSGIAARLSLIERAGGVPVVSLYAAPAWMRRPDPGSRRSFEQPPKASDYGAFAQLCAHVASTFRGVKYFVVWNELKGFWNAATHSWNYQAYTTMYNAVYEAVKRVRPTAMVGGPYAVMSAERQPDRGGVSAVHGRFGFLDQAMLDAVQYWLSHKAGAQFVAVDGATVNAKSGRQLVSVLVASRLYAAVDVWLRRLTALPIWWMESHIEPSGWTAAEGAAARIATLAEMASSGASVGMQWQPQDQKDWTDEGLWTSTTTPGGGKATPLAQALVRALPVLTHSPRRVPNEPPGVLAETDASGTLFVNVGPERQQVRIGREQTDLSVGSIEVTPASSTRGTS